MRSQDITRELLRARYDIFPEEGRVFWNVGFRKGREAFLPSTNTYNIGMFHNLGILRHLIVWCEVHDEWIIGKHRGVRHIDGNTRNDAIANLELVSAPTIKREAAINSNNTSGVKGVSFVPDDRRLPWRASWYTERGKKESKCFISLDEAAAHRTAMEQKYNPMVTEGLHI